MSPTFPPPRPCMFLFLPGLKGSTHTKCHCERKQDDVDWSGRCRYAPSRLCHHTLPRDTICHARPRSRILGKAKVKRREKQEKKVERNTQCVAVCILSTGDSGSGVMRSLIHALLLRCRVSLFDMLLTQRGSSRLGGARPCAISRRSRDERGFSCLCLSFARLYPERIMSCFSIISTLNVCMCSFELYHMSLFLPKKSSIGDVADRHSSLSYAHAAAFTEMHVVGLTRLVTRLCLLVLSESTASHEFTKADVSRR